MDCKKFTNKLKLLFKNDNINRDEPHQDYTVDESLSSFEADENECSDIES